MTQKPLSEDQVKQFTGFFRDLTVDPELKLPDELTDWMLDYLRGQERLDESKTHPTDFDDRKSTLSKEYEDTEATASSTPVKNARFSLSPVKSTAASLAKYSSKTTHLVHTPKIFVFSGEGSKKDSDFETWKYEVITLIDEGTYSEETITTAARKSLRGEAAKAARRLGVEATIDKLLDKFQVLYGRVENTSDILTVFHQAKQHQDESVTSWYCRIDELLFRAYEYQPDQVTNAADTLRLRFHKGLRRGIRDRIRHEKTSLLDFDKLLHAARRAELEELEEDIIDSEDAKPKKTTPVKMMKSEKTADTESETDVLKGCLCALTSQVSELTKSMHEFKESASKPWTHSNRGHGRGYNYGNYRGNQYRGNSMEQEAINQQPVSDTHNSNENQQGARPRRPIICHRCGQEGHKAYGCCVNLENLNRDESV